MDIKHSDPKNIIVLIFFHYSISTVIPMNKIFNIFKLT